MQTTRQQKIARLIQKDLSDIFLRYARTLTNTLISVSEVRVSPDLAIAHVFLSIFVGGNDATQRADAARKVLDHINDEKSKFRFEMGNLERHQLRIIPELNFHLDETIDKMERIDTLLSQGN
ncbi:MAG: 30S ribosome-binding factor RbfA [Paludibacteraceae bacterium]|nr:30S ribosome-binding factor RbfA [Paludibacteraceae bacterium]